MHNWPYAWALGEAEDGAVRGRIGIAPLPAGSPESTAHAVLGRQLLAVSAYSAHKEQAIDLVLYLTRWEEQKRRTLAGSLDPTISALHDDADIRRRAPFVAQLRPIFEGAVARSLGGDGEQLQQGLRALLRHRSPDIIRQVRGGLRAIGDVEDHAILTAPVLSLPMRSVGGT